MSVGCCAWGFCEGALLGASEIMKYFVRTDAVHFELEASSVLDALAQVIDEGEWCELDTPREARLIRSGAWLLIRSDEASDVVCRGSPP